MKVEQYDYNGHQATVIIPEKPNGKWVWKTEFFYAFDAAERALFDKGYTRVYYHISNKYGNYESVRLMHSFHKDLVKRFNLDEKAILFGFSRGGLYAFNYALFYPESVAKIYLDAPVLNLHSWPPKHIHEYPEMLECYSQTEESFENFKHSPLDELDEFFKNEIPLLIVAGDADTEVPLCDNSGILIEYCKNKGIPLEYYVKPGCAHHPHSLEDVTPIVDFVEKKR